MGIPSEVIMLLMYSIAMMILLGIAINSRRVHRKLNKILSLLTTDEHNKHNIGYSKDKGQDMLPNQSNLTTPENSNCYKAEKQNKNHAYYRAFTHIKSITNIITRKQLNANKTFS